MIRGMLLATASGALSMLAPVIAFSQMNPSYRCTYGDLVRRVQIVYETGVAVPCEVHYYRDTEASGEREVLWRAFNESGYCEARTRELVAGLEDMGWQCATIEPDATPPAAPPADDTDVLGAGDAPATDAVR